MSDPIDPRFAQLLDIQKELDVRKALYKEFDRILVSLVTDGIFHAAINDTIVEIVDNFKETNTGWTRSAVRRFDLSITPKALIEKRARLKARKEAI